MRVRPVHLAVLLFSAGAMLTAQSLRAQELTATWQGTYSAGAEQRRAVIQIAKNPTGGWEATNTYLEFFPEPIHVDSIDLKGSTVRFTINGGKGDFTGKLSVDESSIDGTWTYDHHASPLDLHRATQQTAWNVPFQYQYHYHDVTYARPSPAEATIPFSPKLAFAYMEQGATAWTAERQCIACHTNGSYMVVRPMLTAQLGPPQAAMRDFFLSELKTDLAITPDHRQTDIEPTQLVYIAAGLAIWDANVLHKLSPETAQALDLMFQMQRDTGDWPIGDDNNPPLESNTYQLATVAARAVGNAPGWLAQQHGKPVEAHINKLETLLRAETKPQGDYDRADLLWASAELPGLLPASRQQELVAMIFQHQQADGGWSIRTFAKPEEWGKGNRAQKLRAETDFTTPSSDGHMTGLALIALREAGVPANGARIQRGVHWLLTNQRSSGRWWTRSLNRDGWQFITYSGTVYPLLALSLCNALPTSATLAEMTHP